ncbi:unnamed protein product [Allacma fusca]|uniref:TNFR-Cys domain-containing protein n=1 Tax=Allacma fusca TaxID=39272 RepID=A0A8J2KIA4_9HEXA|nr:unnamed protein product [Allacma fusca]
MMRGEITAPMVGFLLWVFLSTIANSAASMRVCNSDLDCDTGFFCSKERIPYFCTPCFDCRQILKRANPSSCTASSQDCGPCLPGFVSRSDGVHCVEEGEAAITAKGEGENIGSSQSTVTIVLAVLAILTALGLCSAGFLILVQRRLKRKRRTVANNEGTPGHLTSALDSDIFSDEEVPDGPATSSLYPRLPTLMSPSSNYPSTETISTPTIPRYILDSEPRSGRITDSWSEGRDQGLSRDSVQQRAPSSGTHGYVYSQLSLYENIAQGLYEPFPTNHFQSGRLSPAFQNEVLPEDHQEEPAHWDVEDILQPVEGNEFLNQPVNQDRRQIPWEELLGVGEPERLNLDDEESLEMEVDFISQSHGNTERVLSVDELTRILEGRYETTDSDFEDSNWAMETSADLSAEYNNEI